MTEDRTEDPNRAERLQRKRAATRRATQRRKDERDRWLRSPEGIEDARKAAELLRGAAQVERASSGGVAVPVPLRTLIRCYLPTGSQGRRRAAEPAWVRLAGMAVALPTMLDVLRMSVRGLAVAGDPHDGWLIPSHPP